jgi:hypothetical protein
MKNKFIFLLMLMIGYTGIAQEKKPLGKFLKDNYYNQTEIGFLLGRQGQINNQNWGAPQKGYQSLTAQTFNGIKLNPNLIVGVTVGVDWYQTFQVVPIMAGVRSILGSNKDKTRLYLSLDVGQGFTWLNDQANLQTIKGGLTFNPSVGLLIPMKSNSALTLSAGYKYTSISSFQDTDFVYGTTILTENIYKRMAIRLGVSF